MVVKYEKLGLIDPDTVHSSDSESDRESESENCPLYANRKFENIVKTMEIKFPQIKFHTKGYEDLEKAMFCQIISPDCDAGNSPSNRKLPVLQFVAKKLSDMLSVASDSEYEFHRSLTYLMLLLERISHGPYIILYVHTETPIFNSKYVSWLYKLHGTLPNKQRKNIEKLVILHPSRTLRSFLLLARPFLSNKFWVKVRYLHKISKLDEMLGYQTDLPQFVLNYEGNHGNSTTETYMPLTDDLGFINPDLKGDFQCEELKHKVFGCPLSVQVSGEPVPFFVKLCVDFILKNGSDVRGIFRIPGASDSINYLKDQYNKGEKKSLFEAGDIHVACSMLKSFFRELPEPIIILSLYDQVVSLSQREQSEETLAYNLGDVIITLPPHNLDTLGYLMHFLCHISEWTETKMNSSNLALVWAPNILKSCIGPCDPHRELAELPKCIKIVECMINQAAIVFPPGLIAQMPPTERY